MNNNKLFKKNNILPISLLSLAVLYFLFISSNIAISIRSLIGIIFFIFIAFILSYNKKNINTNLVFWGLILQIGMGLFVLKTVAGYSIFKAISKFMIKLLDFTQEGTAFVFGDIGKNLAVAEAFKKTLENAPLIQPLGQINLGFFAFTVLPVVIFVSSLSAVLYYFGILQFIVKIFARGMNYFLKVSGAESLATSMNIFVGQTEAPLLIRPYVPIMTSSELLVVMTAGMATVAGSVMVAYIGLLKSHPTIGPMIGAHLLTASVMAAPAAIVIAKIMLPEMEEPVTKGTLSVDIAIDDVNVIDAAARGALEGLHLALNIGGMLIAFIAFIALINYLIGPSLDTLLSIFHMPALHLSLQKIFSYIFFPFAYLMGVPLTDCLNVANLLGEKLVLNEFVAYIDLGKTMGELSERGFIIASYALCGFANFSSIAIQLGGIGGMAPDRRHELAKLGIRAMIGGTLTGYINATIAGLIVL